jgi:autotransporter-associated beta strand protein
VRGVIFLYPGSGGDWRFRADDTVWQEAARSLGFALVGAGMNAGYMSISEADAQSSLTAILAAAAAATGRAELINAPAVFTGFSLGGYVSTEMANHVRDRVITAVAQRGSSVLNSSQPAETRKVPVLFMPGSEDGNGLTDPNVTSANFSNWRANDGHSAYAIDWRTPHDTFVNQGWSMAWVWIAETIALRYPDGVLPGLDAGGTVTLKSLPLETGWLGQRPYVTSTTGADRSAHVSIAPYASYSGTVGTASWLPNETVARAYQAQTSFDGVSSRTEIPLQGPLAIVGAAKPDTAVQPGQINPPQMAILPVGSTFDIAVDPRGFGGGGGVASMAYYDGDRLLAVQAAPSAEGWKHAHTLTERGIHGLTVVATDAFGSQSSAFRAVVAAEPVEQGVSHYRFERSPGFKADHYDTLNLTSNAATGGGPQQAALGATGAGAAFPRSFEGECGQNDHAARFQVANGDVFTCADSPLLPSGATPFTVEAFVNLASGGAGGTFRTIAAHGTGSTGSTLSWQLVVTGEGSGQGPRRLVLQFCGSASGALDTINSGFELQTNVDYYVAAAFTPTNTSASGITFFFKDLSAGSVLQASSRTHTQTSITNASTAFAVGNRYNRDTGWDGLLDEVRLTTRALSVDELLVNQVPLLTTPGLVTPEDSRIAYSDYVRRSFVAAPFDATVTLARFDRLLPMAGKGYEWDNPGTRIRFRTDATNAQATLYYSTNHCSTSARNGRGFYRVDGLTNAAWAFQSVATATVRTPEQVVVTLTVPPGGGFHDYEVVLPYGDSVDFQGLQVNTNAQFQTPAERPATRYLAYGDSITHGFTASEVGKSYAFRVAELKNWQLVNLGLGGRASTAADGTTVGSLQADVVSVLIGVNDWQGGVPLATYSNRLNAFLTNLRALQPAVPVYLLTPLWVDASWNPASDIAPLESYRQVVRDVAAARNDPELAVIEGPELIDPDMAYFDAVLVHPNDAGFALMAERLVARMQLTSPTSGKAWFGGTSANWGEAGTWTPSGVPSAADAVSISNAAIATLTIQSGTAAVAASLTFDNASGRDATLAIADGGSLAVGGTITQAGTGQATISNITLATAASTISVMPAGPETLLTFTDVSGPGGLLKTGEGVLRLTGAVTHAGTNTISAGTLDFAGNGVTLLSNVVSGSGVFRHSGGGTTVVDAAVGRTNTFSGPVVVDAGTLQHGTANGSQRRGLSNASSYTVNAGGTMVATRDAMRDNVPCMLNNGTLRMLKGFQFLGPLTLNGGALVTGPGQGVPYQAFALGANVAVTGSAPSVIRAEPGAYNGVHLAFNSVAGVRRTFRVEDVTGNPEADLTVSANLRDSSHTGNSAGLTKTGAGTMVLSGGTNVCSGATAVSNGTLLVSNGGISNSAVTVSAGATFGTADATLSRVAALTLAEGARLVWKYDGTAGTAGRIAVVGTLTLPVSLTLDVSGSGLLYSGQALFSAGAFAGATDLSGWTITGIPFNAQAVRVGSEVLLQVNRGMILKLR